MGLFDGLGGQSLTASSYEIARITKTPILLVLNSSGASRSIVPLVKGFLDYDKAHSDKNKNLIRGIFLNQVSESQFIIQKNLIEDETNVKVIGFLPKNSQSAWKSRHLGLIMPNEIENLREQIGKTAEILEKTTDFSLLETIMAEAQSLTFENKTTKNTIGSSLKLAVARDEAFCFYYHENLRLLEEAGAKIEFFSPLHDKTIPSEASGILIGGGYPELYAAKLQENETMRKSIKSAIKNGISVLAECGGFMYLQEKIIASGTTKIGGIMPISETKCSDKNSYEMCGAIKGECRFTEKLVRFGYAEFSLNSSCVQKDENFLPQNFSIKGHEFHYFDSTNNGQNFTAKKPLSLSKSWQCMIHTPKMLLGFPHLYYRSNPEIVSWFVESCRK